VEIAGSNPAGGTTLAAPIRIARGVLMLGDTIATMSPLDYLGVHIDTIVEDNVAIRCDGCLEVIDGTPWRMNILDVVAAETPVSWTDRPPINPGPFEFHGDGSHVRTWMRARGYLFCRKGEVREIMRPIPIPGAAGAPLRYGLCDGLHRDDHELIPA
jgi:hypothetical protein